MRKSVFTACIVAFAVLASPGMAQNTGQKVQDAIIAQLTAQGFTKILISNTFLGRVRVSATSPSYTREIIFNPRTGEILRDYWDDEDDDGLVSPFGGGLSGGGNSDDRDGDRDDLGNDDRAGAGGNSSGNSSDDSNDDSNDDDSEDDDSEDDD